jgi:CheY-like chemotaxis protein/anti-sigma regulatory factor (Ser/Thr protein kinase)
MLLEPDINPFSGDPERLQQIVWNLLSNAIKFTPKGGRVEIQLERIHSHVEIKISDNGQGIAADFLLHVFERFRQSDSSSTRRHGGLGLGLSIVSQLVELHGGTVVAESPGVGKGTMFKVILPQSRIHHNAVDGDRTRTQKGLHPPADSHPSLTDLRVLVVDDEPDARDLIAAVLRGHGAVVVTVESANEALSELERQQFDVLVSDIGMPDMDGYALIKKIRRLPTERGGKIPAAALTAYARIEDRRRVLSAGYQMHIAKPVEADALTTAVAKLAERLAKAVGKIDVKTRLSKQNG